MDKAKREKIKIYIVNKKGKKSQNGVRENKCIIFGLKRNLKTKKMKK